MMPTAPRSDTRDRLSAERIRVISESSDVRRQATAALAVMTLVFIVGGFLVWLSVNAEQTISRLNSLTEEHSSLIDRVGYRTDLVLHDEFRRSAPPEFVQSLTLEYDEYAAQDERLRSEIDQAIADARSAPTKYLSFVSDSDLDELEGSVVDPRLLSTAWLAAANLTAGPDTPLTDDEVALRSALTSHDFSAPAEHAEVLVQRMVDDSRDSTTRFTLIVGISTAVMIIAVWFIALRPALVAYQDLLGSLDSHAAEIERSYARAAAAQRIARLGYWYKSATNDAIECSAELAEILTEGVRSPPTTLRELAALTAPTQSEQVYATYRRLISTGGEAEMTHTIVRDGQPDLTLRERVESFPASDSFGLTGVILDISEIVTAQQVLLRMEKFEIVELLISGVAHDFNNLLGIISGNAELALASPDGAVEGHLDAIIDASIAAAGLIGQLRQTAMDPLAVAERFGIAESLRRVVASLSPQSDTLVALDIEEPAATSVVLANQGVFESSIVNLIKNSFEAIGDDGGRVDVRLSIDDPGDGSRTGAGDVSQAARQLDRRPRLRVAVADDGGGMTDEVRRRALQPFFTTKGQGKAPHMGLGLWSVFSFAKAWDGAVHIDSTDGIGTKVVIELPVAGTEDVAEPAERPLYDFAEPGRVLLVEDIDELLAIGEQTLRSWGLDVVTASDFDQAARILRNADDIRLVVTDVRLGPGATGFNLALMAIERDPPIGVVLVSGAFAAEEIPAGLDHPLCIFLPKPFHHSDLHRAVDGLLRLTTSPAN